MKLKNLFKCALTFALAALLVFGVAACDKTPVGGKETVKISIGDAPAVLEETTTVNLTVTVTGSEDTTFVWTISHPDLVEISAENVLSVKALPEEEQHVTITATANADATAKASKIFTIKPKTEPTPPPEEAKVVIGDTPATVKKGDVVNLTVTVTGLDDKTYEWKISHPDLVSISKANVLAVVREPKVDTKVTVTAVSKADPLISADKSFVVKAPIIEGEVGELNSELIAEISNPSITVRGTLTDYYTDLRVPSNSKVNVYDMSVKMEEGAWSGSWNIKGSKNAVTDIYRIGADGAVNANGEKGHYIMRRYIDKHNKVASTPVKDNMSISSVWEAQHMWNHLGNLDVNSFVYDVDNNVYTHTVNVNNIDDLYLMTYLSFSLTPMLSDTLSEINFVIENGHITKLIAQTETLYYGGESGTQEDASAMSYTSMEIAFSDIGETRVADPAPYEAPRNGELLSAAVEKMQGATNYTFRAVDTNTYSPPSDSGDYEVSGYAASPSDGAYLLPPNAAQNYRVSNNVSATGTVGSFGQVTESAMLMSTTIKYDYAMDENVYRTEYSGYRQYDGYYEEFAYDGKLNDGKGALYGTRRINGSMFDRMPKFDFSVNIFKWSGSRLNNAGKQIYTFVLNDSAITRDMALETSVYRYASNAAASTNSTFTIEVDEDGNLVSITYPYSINFGTYLGYVSTTYSKVGTTEIEADTFDDYVQRQVKNSWSDYQINYRPTHSTIVPDNYVSGDVVIDAVFGEYADKVPAPSVLLGIFKDNLSGPWFNWKERTSGSGDYIDHISIITQSMEYDENMRITNWAELIEEIDAAMTAVGYKIQESNTDRWGTRSSSKSRYLCYTYDDGNGGVQVVFENNGTSWIYIDIYNLGDWRLSARA